MWGLIAAVVVLIIIGVIGLLIYLNVVPNPVEVITTSSTTGSNDIAVDTTKLSNQDLIKNIKKNAATDELAQSYLDGGEIKLDMLSNATLQKLYFMKGVELRYAFGIVPVIIHADYDAVIKSFNKETGTFGGAPITDPNATGFTDYVVIRDKVDKLKRLWSTTTSSPYPSNDQVFYTNILALS